MSAIYKEGYWYPADSLNTLKAVTMSNEDYEALTPQEKEELGGIEIFIPDRPLTGGGTGAVIIYNGVEYAGTPTSRLETLEEIVGDGQQSVGSDLTDAVTQLNSSFAHTIYNGNDGTGVDLKPYTSSNLYQFPYDGYVTVNSGTGVTNGKYIRVAIRSVQGFNVAHIYMIVQGAYQIESVFVRKGMQALFAGSDATNNYSITYFPLTN